MRLRRSVPTSQNASTRPESALSGGLRMAYAKNFNWDVFISYARFDNEEAFNRPGWVSEFVKNLKIAVRQRLGDADNFRPYLDTAPLHAGDQLQTLLDNAKKSALFLAIASPSYAKRDWTQRELEAFLEVADKTQLLAVERLRLAEEDRYPAPLDTANRMPFWRKVEESLGQEDIPLEPSDDLFRTRINSLSSQIANKLRALNKAGKHGANLIEMHPTIVSPPKAAPQPEFPLERSGKTILLAQVTENLELESEELRSYLEQYEYNVLPIETYPQGAETFSRAFTADAAKADLIIQLLDQSEGRIPKDLSVSYPRFQAEIIASIGKDCVRWRRPDLQISRVRNSAYRSLLQDATVTASTFESFKSQVLNRLSDHRDERPTLPDAMIFINADADDHDLAKKLQNNFEKQDMATVLPMRTGAAAEVRTDLEENYVDCDVVVFVYGSTSPSWVRGQMRLFNKIKGRREKPPRAIAVLIAPPFDKPDIGMRYPGASEIVLDENFSEKALKQLLTK